MTERPRWGDIKGSRGDRPKRRNGYEEAKTAFEWEEPLRAKREGVGLTQAELVDEIGSIQRGEGGRDVVP